ncbi:hypothetical protein MPH_10917 [Macrophomina phaseolina MS6]|uniref:Zn(2)-C6 fungal-type domain-containing protein n=1 Tax=Macrophomina phaseolina (strain MS6) TaxID=1126212 RepID=K2RGM5_MACPH|nr:hypothetical protein MPH_10917 [Macrophomina phaseolina MS6]
MERLRFVNVRPNFRGDSNRFPRPRPVTSCLQCRRRKVRCDHAVPECSACRRGNYACSYATSASAKASVDTRELQHVLGGRTQEELPTDDILARLGRLEDLIGRVADGPRSSLGGGSADHLSADTGILAHQPYSPGHQNPSATNPSSALASDGLDGTLLLEDGQSHYVSSVHWALLADEIHDIRTLLRDRTEDDPGGSDEKLASATNEDTSCMECPNSLLFGHTTQTVNIVSLLPADAGLCHYLLDIFISNVDPMTRIVHKPSLLRRFERYIKQSYHSSFQEQDSSRPRPDKLATNLNNFEPLAFAIMYSAVNSMKPQAVWEKFDVDQPALLRRFQQGAELCLNREGVLTSSSLEVLQAFVLLLSSQFREDDLGKSWPLTGLAIRIAIDQGLHREPSLFPSGNMNAVQAELRRRLWHQLCHLDFRSAEGKGHEPAISDDDFTTLLPQNINDEDILEGTQSSLLIESKPAFTDMTAHLIRLNGIHCFRKVIQSTYRLERRISKATLGNDEPIDPVLETQRLYQEVRNMVDSMLEKQQTLYLCHCDPEVPLQGISLGLAALLEWKCWVIFWLRVPRAYRDVVISTEVRMMIFEKSVMLLENLMAANMAKGAEPFQWHINGHSAFQAIMHIISELKNPHFRVTSHDCLHQRAISALRMMRKLKEAESSKTWKVVRRMIDRIVVLNYQSSSSSHVTTLLPAEGIRVVQSGFRTQALSSQNSSEGLDCSNSIRTDAGSSHLFPLSSHQAGWENTDGDTTLADAPDLSELSGEFDWGWWNFDSLPWSPPA